jgi:hypothetical protein
MQAVMLSAVGMDEEAEQRLNQILAQKPDQPTAKRFLKEIQAKRQKTRPSVASAQLRAKLEKTIVPEVDFKEAKAEDVIEFLRKESPKLTPDKTPINFVWMVPAEAKPRPVTLMLKKVPVVDVLQYMTEAAGLRYRVDPNAVVIYSPASTTIGSGNTESSTY